METHKLILEVYTRCLDGMKRMDVENETHIIPISHFRFTSVKDKEFKMCWSLNNLQPLWKEINSTKSAKINFYSEDILEKFGVLDIYKLIKDKINE